MRTIVLFKYIVQAANRETDAGSFPSHEGLIALHIGGFLESVADADEIVVGIANNIPVYLRDVAEITDGPGEPSNYVFFGHGPASEAKGPDQEASEKDVYPAVTLTVAKRKGSNKACPLIRPL